MIDFNPWIGVPLVFGRLRHDVNTDFQAIGKLVLSPNGRLLPYRYPNEDSWAISDDQLLLFDQHGRSTTAFNSCDDFDGATVLHGDCLVAPTRHFLYRHDSVGDMGCKIIFLISSAVGYEVPRAQILNQMVRAGVEPHEIWVTISNADHDEVELVDGIHFSHFRGNAYEYGALLDVIRRDLCFDYAMLLHDTCDVGSRLKQLVYEQPATLQFDYMSASETGQFNIGLYSRHFLTRIEPFLMSLVGVSKGRAIEIEHNRGGEGFKSRSHITTNVFDSTSIREGKRTPYGPSRPRVCSYLRGIDVRKFFFPVNEHGFHPDAP